MAAAATPIGLNVSDIVIVLLGYAVTFLFSGLIVRGIIREKGPHGSTGEGIIAARETDLGLIIGKCENFLGITFILANEITGLALLFTAKSILRADDIKKNPKYYLGGTMVNFSFTVLMGYAVRVMIEVV